MQFIAVGTSICCCFTVCLLIYDLVLILSTRNCILILLYISLKQSFKNFCSILCCHNPALQEEISSIPGRLQGISPGPSRQLPRYPDLGIFHLSILALLFLNTCIVGTSLPHHCFCAHVLWAWTDEDRYVLLSTQQPPSLCSTGYHRQQQRWCVFKGSVTCLWLNWGQTCTVSSVTYRSY